MNPLVNWTQIAANLATVAAIVGVWIAYKQWKSGLHAQQEATALGIWKDYVQLALSHPELASPGADIQGQDRKSATFRKYEWFVSAMLFACEQIVALQPRDREWRASVLDHLRIHLHYLSSDRFHADRYSTALRELISTIAAEANPNGLGRTGPTNPQPDVDGPTDHQQRALPA